MNIKRIERILNCQSCYPQENEMSKTILNELQKIVTKKDIIITPYCLIANKGTGIKPCFCSHIDTVHNIVDNYKVIKEYHQKDVIYSSPTGIGGDDKNGIILCLELLENLDNVQVCFFSGEEVGCVGSNKIDLKYFDDCSCLIGLDRKGNSDIISDYWYSSTISKDFEKVLNKTKIKHGYNFTEGFITDVFTLFNRDVGASCINLSCGYYQPHTKNEYISFNDICACYEFCVDIYQNLKPVKYECFQDVVDYADAEFCCICGHNKAYDTLQGYLCVECMVDIINDTVMTQENNDCYKEIF